MAKDKTVYVCDYCGQESVKWMGKCPACNRWGTMKEMKVSPSPLAPRGGRLSSSPLLGEGSGVRLLHEIEADAEPRMELGDGELNRVLGGGMVHNKELVQKITESLEACGTVDAPAKLLGKNICMSFNPKAAGH